MNLLGWSGLLNFITSASLAVLLFYKYRSGKLLIKLWAWYALGVSIWGFACIVISKVQNGNIDLAYFWWRMAYVGVIFLPIIYYHFVCEFIGVKRKFILVFCYFLASLFFILNLLNVRIFLGSLNFEYNQFYWTTGPSVFLIAYMFLFVFGLILLSHLELMLSYSSTADKKKKTHLLYFAIGGILGWGGGWICYLENFNLHLYPQVANFFVAFYAVLYGYAILKHQLMDMRVIIKKTLIFASLLIALSAILVLPALIIQDYFLYGIKWARFNFIKSMNFTWYSFLALSGSLGCVLISVVTYLRVRNNSTHKWFPVAVFGIAFWTFDSFFMSTFPVDFTNKNLYIHRFFYLGAFLSQFAFMKWAQLIKLKRTGVENIIVLLIMFGWIAIGGLNFSNNFVSGATSHHFFCQFLMPSKYYIFFVLLCAATAFYGISLIYKQAKSVTGDEKAQLAYIIFFCISNYIAGIVYFLFVYNFKIYPVADFFVVIACALMSYAIIRYRVMGVNVIIKKTLVFTGLFIFVYALFVGIALLSQNLFQNLITVRWLAMVPSVLIVIFALKPLEKMLVNITDRFLFQKKYDYKDLLKVFTEEVLTVLELNKLVSLTVDKLVDIVRVESCAVLLRDREKDTYYIAASYNITDVTARPDSSEEAKRSLGAEVIVPIVLNNRRIGMVALGKKKSDEAYTDDDMGILLPLSRTLAIAISNAEMFETLSKTQAEAAQQEKMAIIGTLAAGMAHEIRNPITTIKIFTEFLKERKDDPQFIAKFKYLIPKEVAKINDMITHLLEFSKPADYKVMEDVNIGESLREVLEILEAEMTLSDIMLEEHIGNVALVRGNRKYIQEVFFNLIQNAVHAIERRGRIIITAEETIKYVVVKIMDTGCGIPPENIAHIFEPFFTTKMDSKGVGLGLYVIKQLMMRMDGDITVNSFVGKGTIFKLRFMKK